MWRHIGCAYTQTPTASQVEDGRVTRIFNSVVQFVVDQVGSTVSLSATPSSSSTTSMPIIKDLQVSICRALSLCTHCTGAPTPWVIGRQPPPPQGGLRPTASCQRYPPPPCTSTALSKHEDPV